MVWSVVCHTKMLLRSLEHGPLTLVRDVMRALNFLDYNRQAKSQIQLSTIFFV
jgi:hypothetical protein